MHIGIIKEGKTPPDSRVPLTPEQCVHIQQTFGITIHVQPSPSRCFPDEDYIKAGIEMRDDLSHCEVLMGVKEVPIAELVPDKTYFFFSHTIKKQAYNQSLLWAILDKNIRLLDYEVLTNDQGQRLIAFGKFAGMVGAHNGLWTYGKRTGSFDLPRMNSLRDYEAAKEVYQTIEWPAVKIVLTGTGRVANGAAQVLEDMGISKVHPKSFLSDSFDKPVFTQLDCEDYACRKDGTRFDLADFFKHPGLYKSIFQPYTQVAQIMINGIYWDNQAPAFFTAEEMARDEFKIAVIADVTCDIAPVSSIPSTLKAATIADPVFGYDPNHKKETTPFQPDSIDMMTIDNLPNELPRDASTSFGHQFIEHILPPLMVEGHPLIQRATVTKDGVLGPAFQYLADYAMRNMPDSNIA